MDGRAPRQAPYPQLRSPRSGTGGSLSGLTGGPLFAVGGNRDNETTILQQPQP